MRTRTIHMAHAELFDVRRIRADIGTASAQIAVERMAYSRDRGYAWQGRYDAPRRAWHQESLETWEQFRTRVRRNLGGRVG